MELVPLGDLRHLLEPYWKATVICKHDYSQHLSIFQAQIQGREKVLSLVRVAFHCSPVKQELVMDVATDDVVLIHKEHSDLYYIETSRSERGALPVNMC